MSKYMSRSDKDNYAVCAIMRSRYKALLDNVQKNQPQEKKIITALKYVITYAEKACNAFLDDKEPLQQAKAIEDSLKYNMLLKYNDDAMREYKQLQQMQEVEHIPREKLQKLVCLALASCSACECTGDDVKNCPYRKLLIECDVDALDLNGECGFRYERQG